MGETTPSTGQVGIENRAFNATIATGIASGLTALGGAAVGVIKLFQADTPAATVVAALALVAVGLIAIAIVVSADIRARAAVEVASLQPALQASSSTTGSAAQAVEADRSASPTQECCPVVATTGARMGVTVGDEVYAVLAIRVDPRTDETRFLLARPNSLPRWRGRDELDNSLFAFDAHGFPVRE